MLKCSFFFFLCCRHDFRHLFQTTAVQSVCGSFKLQVYSSPLLVIDTQALNNGNTDFYELVTDNHQKIARKIFFFFLRHLHHETVNLHILR